MKDIETVLKFMEKVSNDFPLNDLIRSHEQDIERIAGSYNEYADVETIGIDPFLEKLDDLVPLQSTIDVMTEALNLSDKKKISESSSKLIDIIDSRIVDLEQVKKKISTVDWNQVCRSYVESIKIDEDILAIANEEVLAAENMINNELDPGDYQVKKEALGSTVHDLLEQRYTTEKRLKRSDVFARKKEDIEKEIDKHGSYLKLVKQLLIDYLSSSTPQQEFK